MLLEGDACASQGSVGPPADGVDGELPVELVATSAVPAHVEAGTGAVERIPRRVQIRARGDDVARAGHEARGPVAPVCSDDAEPEPLSAAPCTDCPVRERIGPGPAASDVVAGIARHL